MCLPIREIVARIFQGVRPKRSQPAPAPEKYEEFKAMRYLPSPSSTYSHYVDNTESVRPSRRVAINPDGPIDLADHYGLFLPHTKEGQPICFFTSIQFKSRHAQITKGIQQSFNPAPLLTWQ